jgi:hypothetical protein
MINWINAKFRTPKIKCLYRTINHINIIHNTNIEKLFLNVSKLESNTRLIEFTDADGHFQISL